MNYTTECRFIVIVTRYEHSHQSMKIRTLYRLVMGSDFCY